MSLNQTRLPVKESGRRQASKLGQPTHAISRIGVISDTHSLIRPEALEALAGVDRILHAGDVGSPDVLVSLSAIAPVTAIRGNNDRGAWAEALPETATISVGGVAIHVIHDRKELAVDPSRKGIAVVVSGHSHRPRIVEERGVLFVNPGSAGPRRFKLPVTVARLTVASGAVRCDLVTLSPGIRDGAGQPAAESARPR